MLAPYLEWGEKKTANTHGDWQKSVFHYNTPTLIFCHYYMDHDDMQRMWLTRTYKNGWVDEESVTPMV